MKYQIHPSSDWSWKRCFITRATYLTREGDHGEYFFFFLFLYVADDLWAREMIGRVDAMVRELFECNKNSTDERNQSEDEGY
jgi:hypothetical protein